VSLRAVNAAGPGPASIPVSGTPSVPVGFDPDKPEKLVSSPGEQWSEVRLAGDASRIVANSDGEIAVWDRASGARVATFAGAYAGLSEDATRIASLKEGVVELRRAADGGLISAFGKDVGRVRLGATSGSIALTFRERDGKQLLQVWDADRGVEVPAFARRALAADDAYITTGKPGLIVVRRAGRVDAFDRGTAKPVWSSPRELAIEGAEPSPSGARLMTWGKRADAQSPEDESWVSIVELPGGKEVRSQRYNGRVLDADWGFEERTVLVQSERRAPASGSNDLEWTKKTISLWNVKSGRRTAIPVSRWSETYASADRRWQIATGTDGTVRVVDGISGDVLTTIDSQSGPIRKSDFTPDGRMLAVGDAQGVVQVFELPSLGTGTALARDGRKPFSAERQTVMFARDGADALGLDVEGRLTLWSTESPASARIHTGGQIIRARMDRLGHRVVIADRFGESQRIRLLDRAGSEHWSLALREYESLAAVELSHDGGRVVVAKGMPGGRVRAQVFELTGQGDARTLGAFEYAADDRSTPPIAFAPDGRFVATGDADGRVRIWDAETGALVRGRGAHESPVRQLLFDPESRHLVSVGGDGRIQVWSTLDWTMRELPARHRSVVFHAAFSADGTRFLTVGKDNLIRVADPALAGHLADIRLTKTGIVDAQFSGDGKWIVTATEDRYIRVWDAVLGEQIAEFRGPEEPAAVAFAPNGTDVIAIDRSAVQWRFKCRGCAPADEIQSAAVRMGRILAAVADPKHPPSASRDE
jgi:WD40 repeat protein